jgi:hypothetical protein
MIIHDIHNICNAKCKKYCDLSCAIHCNCKKHTIVKTRIILFCSTLSHRSNKKYFGNLPDINSEATFFLYANYIEITLHANIILQWPKIQIPNLNFRIPLFLFLPKKKKKKKKLLDFYFFKKSH